MERIRKYFYKDGFTLMETIEREKRNVPFSFLYYTDGNKHVRTYMACYDGEQYTNCQREQNGNVTVIFKNHDLGIGPLVCEKTFYTPTDLAWSREARYASILSYSPSMPNIIVTYR